MLSSPPGVFGDAGGRLRSVAANARIRVEWRLSRQRRDATGEWSTLTHARIRAAQGDLAGAREILESVLARTPDDERARRMMRDLESGAARPVSGERDELVPPRLPANPRALAGQFRRSLGRRATGSARRRIARLERWLRAVGGPGSAVRPDGS